jgi:phosphoribosylformylglycinamidine synthase I
MSKVKFGILVFPGSNCDHDAHFAASSVMKQDARFIWHKESSLGEVDVVVIPGGFSYGDYLRCGAIARFSPIMNDVVRFANSGGAVIGICNGFQILTEVGLLPGALLRNESLRFVCKDVYVRVEQTNTRFTGACAPSEVLRIPIAHGEGRYVADVNTLQRLEGDGRVVFRYATPSGQISPEANPNGSMNNIAGITNEAGNVLGLMPHPERASDPLLGNTDGQKVFQSLIQSFTTHEFVHNLS